MKKILYILMFLVTFSCLNVFAVEKCTTSELARLKELANNVEFKKSYIFSEEDVEYHAIDAFYDIEILNNSEDLKLLYKSIYYDDDYFELPFNESVIGKYIGGDKIKIQIYSYTDNLCTERLLKTITIDLPVYNEYYYYNKEKCVEYPEFKYCKEFLDVSDIQFKEIDDLFDEYKKSKVIDNIIDDVSSVSWYWYLLGGMFVVTVIIVIVISKKKKSMDKI